MMVSIPLESVATDSMLSLPKKIERSLSIVW